ncbi:hypothetical protein LL962_04955 [Xanthomonas sp. NCPPB 1067]|uniref:hypothetical protein n=1 Tax=Xanthomonas sp. NCPPB 1067 TaxID=487524 RepID=UPI001E58552A|nr:hypothetical protein [Xanthomonas sp. NCPPB 1067]MCC4586462.1 hypothetical protein [Xanthomonas sp. NCPPB 1067]
MISSRTLAATSNQDAAPNARPPTPGQPLPDDEIPFKADVWRDNGRIVGATFKGQISTTRFNGRVKTGGAEVNVERGNAFGSASTNGTSMDGRVGFRTGLENFELSASFAPGGELSGSGKVTVGDASFSFSNDSIGTEFKFANGASAAISRSTDGAWNASWSSPAAGSFQTALNFENSGGNWSINANFTLKVE